MVQGTKENPDKMNIEIDNVLVKLNDTIRSLNETELENHKSSLKNELIKPHENLNERFLDIFREIELGTFDYERKYKLVKEVPLISLNDIISAFQNIFFRNPRKLSIQLYGNKNAESLSSKNENYNLNSKIISKVYSEFDFLHKQ